MATEPENPDLDLIAASLRADSGDLSAFVEGLATKLEQTLPAATTVRRARRGLMGPKQVTAISVDAGGQRLLLERHGDHVHTARARTSGGIVLKTEPLDVDAWLAELTAALAAEAQRSEAIRRALERLLL